MDREQHPLRWNNGIVYTRGDEINGEYYSSASATDWSDAPEIYTGATTSGTQCAPVPQSAIPGGMSRLTGGSDDRPVHHSQLV
jgi:hypothetical protein